MDMATQDLLTVAGLGVATSLIVSVITRAAPSIDTQRFGPLLALGVALLIAVPTAIYLGADPIQALLTALIAGTSASGIYDTTKTTVSHIRG